MTNEPTKYLFWIDLEMTGLDVEKERIIEAAAIITDWNLNELEVYHSVVKQPQSFLDGMDEWNLKTHTESGLIEQIPNGKEPDIVEQELAQLIGKYFNGEPAVMAGNSIGQDRLFINKYFTRLADKLHYRMLDVTSFKIYFKDCLNMEFKKQNTHKALDDIRESIAEFHFYTTMIDPNKQN